MPDTEKQLFIITASNPDAARHVEKSISHPIDRALCEQHFPSLVLSEVTQSSQNGKFYAWGARPGQNNVRNWERMRPGDYVLLYQNRNYTFWTAVISKHRNAAFAVDLWGKEDGETWELMYFLQPAVSLQCAAQKVADALPSQYMGFTPIAAERVQTIVAKYGSIERFIAERMQGPTHLLLRSNQGSEWADQEGSSYHYGNTVPNHTAVASRAHFLLDRVYQNTKRIFAVGTIGTVTEEAGTGKATKTFRAAYQEYRLLRPPRVITKNDESLIGSIPGYNVQHSIRKINADIFEKLSQPATAWIFQANPDVYDLARAVKKLKIDTFLANQHANEIKTGDRVYLWQSGKQSGIVGLAEVIEEPRPRMPQAESLPYVLDQSKIGGEKMRAQLRLLGPVDPPISREGLLSLPQFSKLSILTQPNATNFRVTPTEAEAIEELLSKEPEKIGKTEHTDVSNSTRVPKNLILCGPPGTGKAFHTVDKALEILDPTHFAEHKDHRAALKQLFDKLQRSGRIEFVTFHQSFAFEDFVEGIRAETTSEGLIRYDVKPGVFKDLCARARRASRQGKELGVNDSPRIWKISIDGTGPSTTREYCLSHGEARIGWGGVGDLRNLDEMNEEFKRLGPNDRSTLTTFYEKIRSGDILVCIKSVTDIQAVGVVEGEYEFNREVPAEVKADYNNIRRTNWFPECR
jgi:predicted RNA-binding protein with PUA-like domain